MKNRKPYIPFTYHLCWSSLDIHYYGAKYSKRDAHPDVLWNPYKTSSRRVKSFIELHGDPDIIEVRKTFNTLEEAIKWENRVLEWFDAKGKDNWLNESNGWLKYKDSQRFKGKKHSEKSKSLIGEKHKGIVSCKDADGHYIKVSKEEFDNRIDLVGMCFGNPKTEEHKRKIRESNKETWKDGHTPEMRKFISESNSGRVRITNGVDFRNIKPNDIIPEGWYFGSWEVSVETRRKNGDAHRGDKNPWRKMKQSQEMKDKRSQTLKEFYANEENRKILSEKLLAAHAIRKENEKRIMSLPDEDPEKIALLEKKAATKLKRQNNTNI